MSLGARTLVARLGLMLLGTLIGVGLAELIARAAWSAPWYERLEDEQRPPPHLYESNEYGLRDDDFVSPKPPGSQRVLVLGDSFTFGLGVEDRRRVFPELLEADLNAQAGGGVDVLNGGNPGSLPHHWLKLWDLVAEAYDPDLVLLVFFLRDGTDTGYAPAFFKPIRDEIAQRNRESRAYQLSYLYRVLRDRRDRKNVAEKYTRRFDRAYFGSAEETAEWRRAQEDVIELQRRALQRGTRVGFVVFPVLAELDGTYPFRAICDLLVTFAERNRMPVHNLLPDYLGLAAADLWVSGLNQHPNARGHRIAADALLPFVRQLLAAPSPRPAASQAG